MQAIKQLYKMGPGPSSSHTIGPYRISKLYKEHFPLANRYEIVLCGSLALTGIGHGTEGIISKALNTSNITYTYKRDISSNIMLIQGFKDDLSYQLWHAHSIGGGAISIQEFKTDDDIEVYEENNFEEIKAYLKANSISLLDYVYLHEPNINEYLKECLKTMYQTVETGLNKEGLLNKKLNYYRVAKKLYEKAKTKEDYLMSYSYATCEENASGGMMITAPTLGACGVMTSLMYYLHNNEKVSDDKLCELLIIGGVFANCIKKNATIAGSVGGCQAEIGTATVMASSAIAYYLGADLNTIEYAAEMGMEHYLGLTCDPVLGYVIIPCIERNAVSILKAFNTAHMAIQLKGIKTNAVSFDTIVKTMNYTGNKIAYELRETSLGGLSKEFKANE